MFRTMGNPRWHSYLLSFALVALPGIIVHAQEPTGTPTYSRANGVQLGSFAEPCPLDNNPAFLQSLSRAGDSLDAAPRAGSSSCCDPAKEPGVGGNPLCFEGHSCCADGRWRCNNANGTPSCPGGQVCGSTCGASGASCMVGSDCCSGICKSSKRCR